MASKLNSWGNLAYLNNLKQDIKYLTSQHSFVIDNEKTILPYGMGRSYGDVCLNPDGVLALTNNLDRLISFDEQTGILHCESGVLLKDIQNIFMPKGWVLPVTPGTLYVTVGGAIANDIHGKNHHRAGSFGNNLKSISLIKTSGEYFTCNDETNQELFSATIGGLGLTGLILDAKIQLKPINNNNSKLITETIPYYSLEKFFQLADESEQDWEYTVSWFDCLSNGRGIFSRANFINQDSELLTRANINKSKSKTLTFPILPPVSLVNKLSLKIFNNMYFNTNYNDQGINYRDYMSFMYPLDNLLEWNKIYGPRGFYQYQCVLPYPNRLDASKELLKQIKKSKLGSFLAVLKTFGDIKPKGLLSFPQKGATIALDFPNKNKKTLKLFEMLDQIVCEAGGKVYLAKDARLSKQMFEQAYPGYSNFLSFIDDGISSRLSKRLLGR